MKQTHTLGQEGENIENFVDDRPRSEDKSLGVGVTCDIGSDQGIYGAI